MRTYLRSHEIPYKPFIKRSAMVGIGQIIARVLGMVFFIIVARTYTPTDYGFIQYSITLANMAIIAALLGYPTAITRYLGKCNGNRDVENLYFSNTIVSVLFTSVITIGILSVVFYMMNKMNIGILLIMIGLIVYYLYYGLLRGFILYKRMPLLEIGTKITAISLLIFLFYGVQYCPPLLVLIIFALSQIIPVLLMVLKAPVGISFRRNLISKETLSELFIFSIPLVVASGAYTVISGIDLIFIEYYYNMQEVGIYSVAKTLTQIFVFVPTAIGAILMPTVAGFSREETGKKVMSYLKLSLVLVSLSSLFLLILIYVFGSWLIELIFGAKYLGALNALFILSIGMALSSIYVMISPVWTGIGKPHLPSVILSISTVVNIIGNIYLIPRLGIFGAGIAFAMTYFIALVLLGGFTVKIQRFIV